jgi:hypothetical protein
MLAVWNVGDCGFRQETVFCKASSCLSHRYPNGMGPNNCCRELSPEKFLACFGEVWEKAGRKLSA